MSKKSDEALRLLRHQAMMAQIFGETTDDLAAGMIECVEAIEAVVRQHTKGPRAGVLAIAIGYMVLTARFMDVNSEEGQQPVFDNAVRILRLIDEAIGELIERMKGTGV